MKPPTEIFDGLIDIGKQFWVFSIALARSFLLFLFIISIIFIYSVCLFTGNGSRKSLSSLMKRMPRGLWSGFMATPRADAAPSLHAVWTLDDDNLRRNSAGNRIGEAQPEKPHE